jgi:hypothetical protein
MLEISAFVNTLDGLVVQPFVRSGIPASFAEISFMIISLERALSVLNGKVAVPAEPLSPDSKCQDVSVCAHESFAG